MADRTDLGLALAMARKRKRMNQTELAQRVGISSQWLSNLETGKYKPTKSVALAIASVLDETLESIFGDAYSEKGK